MKRFLLGLSVCFVSSSWAGNVINLNEASALRLTGSFKGIGPKRARAIVQYRETQGPFCSVADLAHIRGLGKHFVSVNQKKLRAVFSVGDNPCRHGKSFFPKR